MQQNIAHDHGGLRHQHFTVPDDGHDHRKEANALTILPEENVRHDLDLVGRELQLQQLIETETDPAVADEARRRLDSASAYYDRDSEPWKAAQRLTRRAERRMDALLPKLTEGRPPVASGENRTHASGFSVHRNLRAEWHVTAVAADELFEEALAAGALTRRKCIAYIQERMARQIDPAVEETAKDASGDGWQLLAGDFRERLAGLTDVDLIVTDPPYVSSMADLWTDLARVAAEILRPGGVLVAMSGKIELADRMERLGAHLSYGWMYVEPLEKGATRILARHVMQQWKPWLAYSKGPWPSGRVRWHGDLLEASTKSKAFRWQQGVETAEYLIDILCPKNGTVVDPFAGHGSYGIAARQAGRRFIGCEMSRSRFQKAAERLQEIP